MDQHSGAREREMMASLPDLPATPETVAPATPPPRWWQTWWFGTSVLALPLLAALGFWVERSLPTLDEAKRLADAGSFESAAVTIDGYLALNRDTPQALLLAGRIRAGLKDWEGCLRHLSQIAADASERPEALLRMGQAALELFHAAEAEIHFKGVIEAAAQHPESPWVAQMAISELSVLLSNQGRVDECHEFLTRALVNHRDPWKVRVTMMMVEERQVYGEGHLAVLRKCHEAEPQAWHTRVSLAAALIHTGGHNQARGILEACLKERQDDPRAWSALLSCAVDQGNRSEIHATLARIPAAARRSAEVMYDVGRAHDALDETDAALTAYHAALAIDPFHIPTHHSLGIMHRRLMKEERSKFHQDRAAQLRQMRSELRAVAEKYALSPAKMDSDSPDAEACLGFARRCFELGRRREALGWLEETVARDRQNVAARQLFKEWQGK